MSLHLHNTLTRRSELFTPLKAGHVGMYVCGMTIYDLCHVGHARMMMAFDLLYRWLLVSGYQVTYVRNITDIDDKIIRRALERGMSIRALTDEMIAAMHVDIDSLGIERPTHEPRATQYVPQMLSLISRLEAKGLAYRAPQGDINFALTKEIYSGLTPWQVTQIARHPQRPYTLDYVGECFTDFHELHGDRHYADDLSIVGGMARFNGQACMVLGHQKGRDTKERGLRNFGMARPEGYRKALRLMKLAEKFHLPVFTFVDTPGAYPGIGAEERGQSEAIGRNIFEMAQLEVPIVSTIIGEGGSGGALAISVADQVLMLQFSVYSRIRNVAKRVAKWARAGHQMVVVPSAMSGETNRLLGLAKELLPDARTPEALRELDQIACTGEQVSVGLLALALQAEGMPAVSYSGWQVPIRTNSAYTKARVESIDDAKVRADLQAGRVVIITGFQGVDAQGNVATLGRGGSDTSAVAVAAALKAAECLIYTDVDGVYTTDPRIVPEARRLLRVSFEEMLEMASMGSKVLQIRSVEFAGKYRVPLRVLSSFTPWDIDLAQEAASGTLITFEEDEAMEQAVVSGIAFTRDEAKVTVVGVPDKPGIAYQILGAVADANIDIDVIVQNVSHNGRTDFSFTVTRGDFNRTLELLRDKVAPALGVAEVVGDNKICKVSIVGIGMRS
ncbi:hypothetical protein B566_EDAN018551, partial [Ephemera danica]